MKCTILRDDLEIAPGAMPPAFVGANAAAKSIKRNGKLRPVLFWKPGTVLDHPQAFWLVRQGVALPADDECNERCGMTPEQMEAAQKAYERVSKGIHPDDYGIFDDGVILGYDEKGDYLPGPNYHLLVQAAAESVEIDDEPLVGGTE